MSNDAVVIGLTESVCPVCLARIPAERVQEGSDVYLRKDCPVHGSFKTVIWRGQPDFATWYQVNSRVVHPPKTLTPVEEGCPYDCGLCPDHRQQSCCVLLEVTQRCNLKCPICFADAGRDAQADPDLGEIEAELGLLMETAGKCNLQLSGGEPAERDDLPEIVALARRMGFPFIQLNTNGLRLAKDAGYVTALKEAGLSTVFLQFDGTRDEIYEAIRGRPLLEVKRRAIANCARVGLPVVLVPTIVPGINAGNIGEIIGYALEGLPVIRGVNFQPVSYFGRYPGEPEDRDRVTLPEIMQAIEDQTGGVMRAADFAPTGSKHCLCSFHGDYLLQEDGTLTPLRQKQSNCCGPRGEEATIEQARKYIASRWGLPGRDCGCGQDNPEQSPYASWDRLLERLRNYRLSITCVAFQDAGNLDLERLQDCSLHFIAGGKIIPFCAYNLSSRDGRFLYREGQNTSKGEKL